MKRYKCLLCGRNKFTQKSPHRCTGGFRKRHIVWQEITDIPDFAQGIVFNPPFPCQPTITYKAYKMKDEIIIDGIKYRKVEEEITPESCLSKTGFTEQLCTEDGFLYYPTEEIAEKSLLYGILHSVAHKLNLDAMFGAVPHILFLSNQKRLDVSEYHGTYTISPVFLGKETAKRAIKIFENSKFDLKKLFQ